MFYFNAITRLKNDMQDLLKKEGLTDYSFSLERKRDISTKGEHDTENKKLSINTDLFHYTAKLPNEKFIYTIVPKPLISQVLLDTARITGCHEVVHAKDFSSPEERFETFEEKERFALEDIACTNPKFYYEEGQPLANSNYHKISFEARAYTQSIYMARDMIMRSDNISQEQANQRIINVLNHKISRDSLFHVDRENPNFNPYKTSLLDEDLENDTTNPYLKDVSFHNFEEVEQRIKQIIDASNNYSWKQLSIKKYIPGIFPTSGLDKANKEKVDAINKDIKSLGFSEDFYLYLQPVDRLYLHATLAIKFYDRYKEVNPNIRNLPERLEKYTNMKVLDLNKLDIRYFERKLEDFLKEHPEFDKEKSPERGSGLF